MLFICQKKSEQEMAKDKDGTALTSVYCHYGLEIRRTNNANNQHNDIVKINTITILIPYPSFAFLP